MRIMLGEDEIRTLLAGEILKVTHSGPEEVEVLMLDIGLLRLQKLLNEAGREAERRSEPGPTPATGG